jgi:hypothetical protein
MATTLLYRTVPHNGGLVFALEHEARRVAQIHRAINTARTWAEFRSLMPRKDYSEVLASRDDADLPRPRGSDEFSGERIPGWSDGDYPTWLQQEMSYVVPLEVLKAYGTLHSTFINGEYWHLPPERTSAIVAALEILGMVAINAEKLQFH